MLKNGALLSIFVVCLLTFVITFAINNDSEVSIMNDERFSALNNSIRANLTQLSQDSNSSQITFLSTTLEAGDEHAGSGGQFKVGPTTIGTLVITSFGKGFDMIFGKDSNFSFIPLTFATLLLFFLGYWAFKAWFGRDPD